MDPFKWEYWRVCASIEVVMLASGLRSQNVRYLDEIAIESRLHVGDKPRFYT
jgi:hypothetical protein